MLPFWLDLAYDLVGDKCHYKAFPFTIKQKPIKVPVKWKIIAAYLKGFLKNKIDIFLFGISF